MSSEASPAPVQLFRLFLVVLGLGAIAFGVWTGLGQRGPKRPVTYKSESERLDALARQDRENLGKKGVREADVYGAMVRLAQHGDPGARQEAIARSTAESVLIRQGAANALGYFDDEEAFSTLLKMLEDKDLNVRVQAIGGLSHKANKKREEVLRDLLKRKNLSEDERIALHSGLVYVSTSQDAKRAAIEELVRIARTEKSESSVARAAMSVTSLAPRDEKVLAMMRDFLKEGRTPTLAPTAIRHLSTVADKWLRENMRKFAESKDQQVRLAIVQSLHFACPADRWSILESMIAGERDRIVLESALREVSVMPGQDGVALLERMIKGEKVRAGELVLARDLLAQLKKSEGLGAMDPCQGRKTD